MLDSRIKDKIYAFLSFLCIVAAIGSFALVVNFLLKLNTYVFSVDEKTVKEETIAIDKEGFEKIKEKINPKSAVVSPEPLINNVLIPSPLAVPSLGPIDANAISPTPSVTLSVTPSIILLPTLSVTPSPGPSR